eukprot:TRINITY_DN3908_c0_g2_i1.p1 TRINITY_DN3908_c0_g2~~TRINITY_DN3908_c0_g2_i1.p1  ORF type:complete len:167 (-),score=1.55 TRINITY_DN3908_c0_g2_i1:262-762(-)
MLRKSEHFYPFVAKSAIILLLIVGDLALNANTNYGGKFTHVQAFGAQLSIAVSIGLMTVLLLGGTYIFEVGLIGILVREFKPLLLALLVYTLTIAITGTYYEMVGKSNEEMWTDPVFLALDATKKIVSPFVYFFIVISLLKLTNKKFYKKDELLKFVREGGLQKDH